MENLCKSAHKVFKIKYHFVFCIKYRKDLFLENKYVQTVKEICKDIENRYHMKFETLGFDEDHVHFLLQTIPKYSPSQIFRIVKSITVIELFKRHKDLKKELRGGILECRRICRDYRGRRKCRRDKRIHQEARKKGRSSYVCRIFDAHSAEGRFARRANPWGRGVLLTLICKLFINYFDDHIGLNRFMRRCWTRRKLI